jgi:hypothetical protein
LSWNAAFKFCQILGGECCRAPQEPCVVFHAASLASGCAEPGDSDAAPSVEGQRADLDESPPPDGGARLRSI